MNDFEQDLYRIIASSPGIRSREIAEILGVDKRAVKSALSTSAELRTLVRRDRWHRFYEDLSVQPDKELQSLCHYYLNCLELESGSSVSQPLRSVGKHYAVLNGLRLDPRADKTAFALLNSINADSGSRPFVGYPVLLYGVRGSNDTVQRRVAPLFLFPVEMQNGKAEITPIPSVNREVLRRYSYGSAETLPNELSDLMNELKMNDPDRDMELSELVNRLKEIRPLWNWAEEIDPAHIPPAADLNRLKDGIRNRAVLIRAGRNRETRGVESELKKLAAMPENEYRGTALYSWVKNSFSDGGEEEFRPLLEVMPLNLEQAEAVDRALRSDLTVVTGPPGTGKTQVVEELLVNVVWNGKKALFASKNDKAVDVVEERVNSLCNRPVILPAGSFEHADRLAEIMEELLSAKADRSGLTHMDYYLGQYQDIGGETERLRAEKTRTMKQRNRLDELEQQYCAIRSLMESFGEQLRYEDAGRISASAQSFARAYAAAGKKSGGTKEKIFWVSVGAKRSYARDVAAREYNYYSKLYGLPEARDEMTRKEVRQLREAAEKFDAKLQMAAKYRRALETFRERPGLEELDRQLEGKKEESASIALYLWDAWLSSQSISPDPVQLQSMMGFIAAMKRDMGGAEQNAGLKQTFHTLTRQLAEELPCCAVTSLSAERYLPFTAGFYDYVIIDEASQCDIASVLPLLYRAKKAVIIGDPMQMNHISQLPYRQNQALMDSEEVPPAWSYAQKSLYDLAEDKTGAESVIRLKDHFRSVAEIIGFSSETFYGGSLRTATRYEDLVMPPGMKAGINWVNVRGRANRENANSACNVSEAAAVISVLKRLTEAGFRGTIGVATPFRRQAELIHSMLTTREKRLYDLLIEKYGFVADTVNKFQGDERDVMIFSTVVNDTSLLSTRRFLNNQGNLFNVAVTRARSALIVTGDLAFCSQCDISYLKKFTEYYLRLSAGSLNRETPRRSADSRTYPWVENPEQVSSWEKVLYTALYDEGIRSIPQYPVDQYHLDLAVTGKSGRRLDIEVDGDNYHRPWNEEMCYRDQLRSQRLFELDWEVKRFWVWQIRDDLLWCVNQIKAWYER